MRRLRRRWGFVLTVRHPSGLEETWTPPVRFWTRSGAQYEAAEWAADWAALSLHERNLVIHAEVRQS